MTDLQPLWHDILNLLRGQMTEAMFETCFHRARPLSLDDNTLVVALISEYAKGWLEQRFNKAIERTLSNSHLAPLVLQFVVEETAQTTFFDNLVSDSPPPEKLVIVRDRRKPHQYCIENLVLDEWRPIIGRSGYDIYSFYVRMANRDMNEKSWPAYSLLKAHLGVGSSTISEYNQLLEWCGLLYIEAGNYRKSNTYYIRDPAPVTMEGLVELRRKVQEGWSSSRRIRQTVLERIENWRPLQALWSERRQKGKEAVRIVRAGEQNGGGEEQDLPEALAELGVWKSEIPRLLKRYQPDTIWRAVERTEREGQTKTLKNPGAYLRTLLDKGYVRGRRKDEG